MKTKTTALLFKTEDKAWALVRYKGDTIPRSEFKTAAAARAYAKKQGWNVRRAANCDE